jgi:hypothetical protein
MNTFAGEIEEVTRAPPTVPDSRQSAERMVPVILFYGANLRAFCVAPRATGALRYKYV